MNASKSSLQEARRQLAQAGYKALKEKTTAVQRQAWRLKGIAKIKANARKRKLLSSLSPERRSEIARNAALARVKIKKKL